MAPISSVSPIRTLTLWLSVIGLLASSALGRPAQDEPVLNEDDVRARRAALEADTALEEAVRAEALADFDAALQALVQAADNSANADRFQQDIASVPTSLESVRAELAQPLETIEVRLEESWTRADVEDRRDQAAAFLTQAEDALENLEAEKQRRTQRQTAFDAEHLAESNRLAELQTQLAAIPSDRPPVLAEALRARLRAEQRRARTQLERLEAEDRRNAAEVDLLPLREDLARREVQVAQERLDAWGPLLREQRSLEAQRTSQAAAQQRSALAQEHEELRIAGKQIEVIGDKLSGPKGVVAETNEASEDLSLNESELRRMRRSYAMIAERHRAGGALRTLGPLLRSEYDRLPSQRRLKLDARRCRTRLADAHYEVLVQRDRRADLGDVGGRTRTFLEELPETTTEAERATLETVATDRFTSERDLVGSLVTSYESAIQVLTKLERSVDELLELTVEYREFMQARILWVRSVEHPLDFAPKRTAAAALWLVRGDPSRAEWAELGADVAAQWYLVVFVVLGFLLALIVRRHAVRRIEHAGPLVRRYKTDSLGLTWETVAWTVLAAAPYPLAFYGVISLLGGPGVDSIWRLGWSRTLGSFALFLVPVLITRQAVRPSGLAIDHFRWPSEACRALRRALAHWWIPGLVLGMLQLQTQYSADPDYRNTLGRLLFLLANVPFSVFVWRCLAPDGTVLGEYYRQSSTFALTRARNPIVILGLAIPVVASVLTITGFFYTARVLGRSTLATLTLVMALVLTHGLALRWLQYHRRRIAVEQAVKKREEQDAQGDTASTEAEVDLDEDVDIPALDVQTRELFRMGQVGVLLLGLATIWGATMPALGVLERVQIWPTLEITPETTQDTPAVAEVTPDAGVTTPAASQGALTPLGPISSNTAEKTEPQVDARAARLSLANVLASLVFLIATVIVARTLPAVIAIGLTRFDLDSGARYAITTLIRYGLIGIGASLTFGALGIGWSSIQWLAAALTFGLAFGLQEIFANFISGLILLVERPIRVGDTVTIGGLMGKVARIRPRATTVLDYDNRERLIPNKTLITSEVTNWTLSDSVSRIVVSVGVAYGSDTKTVFEELLRAAQDCPWSVEDPAPTVLFKGFGDSSLDFDVRFFISSRDAWVRAMNDVHTRIDDTCREHGIEIAFPQRDLHLRSSDVPSSAAAPDLTET